MTTFVGNRSGGENAEEQLNKPAALHLCSKIILRFNVFMGE